MMPLPKEFIDTYHSILGHETQAFLASFQQEAVNAFRVNSLKNSPNPLKIPSPIHYGDIMEKSLASHRNMFLV